MCRNLIVPETRYPIPIRYLAPFILHPCQSFCIPALTKRQNCRYSFHIMQTPFSKLVLITGGTRGGLGFEAARQLLSSGHRVILTLRDEAKAKAAIAALVAEQPSAAGRVQWVVMDLMSLASVRSASQELSQKHATLDVLMVGSAAVPDE